MLKEFTDKLVKDEIIGPEDKALYLFGFKQALHHLITILSVFLLSFIFDAFWIALFFLLFYTPMRVFAGGFHAKTPTRCYIVNNLMLIGIFLASDYFAWGIKPLLIITIASAVVILGLAPVEDKNKPLDVYEVKVYRRRTGVIVAAELLLFAIGLIYEVKLLSTAICLAVLLLAVMLVLGKIKNVVTAPPDWAITKLGKSQK